MEPQLGDKPHDTAGINSDEQISSLSVVTQYMSYTIIYLTSTCLLWLTKAGWSYINPPAILSIAVCIISNPQVLMKIRISIVTL